jgi:hypothetical protein
MNRSIDQKEWEILYNALRTVCAKHGTEDPFGNGDYWIVDDNWGGVTQKLVVSSPRFLTPKLVTEITNCIASTGLLGAQVIVALDLNIRGDKLSPMGLIIDAHSAIEEWDIDLIRKRVGPDFFRESGQVLPFTPPSSDHIKGD